MDYASTKGNSRPTWSDGGVSSYRGPCRLLGAHITRVTSGGASIVLCAEFCEPDGACRLQLAVLAERSDGAFETGASDLVRTVARCVMLN